MKGFTRNIAAKDSSRLMVLPAHPSSALHASILKSILLLKLPRTGSILMALEYCLPCDARTNDVNLSNVCDTKDGYSICFKQYFDRKYTVDDVGRKLLINDLVASSLVGGDIIASNGRGNKNTKSEIRIVCSHYKRYLGRKVIDGNIIVGDHLCYRQSSISNDRKNNRKLKKGTQGLSRTDSSRPFSNNNKCSFTFTVFSDSGGYFLKPNLGNFQHCGHAKMDHIRRSVNLLEKDERELVIDMRAARAAPAHAVNLYYVRSSRLGTPNLLSVCQVSHLMRMADKSDEKKSNVDVVPVGGTVGGTDDLYGFLEKEGHFFISLLQGVKTDAITLDKKVSIFSETKLGSDVLLDPIVVPNELCNKIIYDVAKEHRNARNINDDQEMMIGIAFATPFELRQFKLFHAVVNVDVTEDTNNEGRPLATVTSKDSHGKMFTVLRAFLPNQQEWSFQWLFGTVFVTLLGKECLNGMKVIITDGDSQEIKLLDAAIKSHFPKVVRLRCAWHIIDRGWKKHLTVSLGGYSKKKRKREMLFHPRRKPQVLTPTNKLGRTIYRWIFSWAQPEFCLSKSEFELSVALFLNYVSSKSVVNILGQDACGDIIEFARSKVIANKDHFVYYLRHLLFHLNIYTNCGHEGTNNGIKHCAAAVSPRNSVHKSVGTLNFNAQKKAKNTCIKMCAKSNSTKLWTSSPTSSVATDIAESMILQQWERRTKWKHVRVEEYRWLVLYNIGLPDVAEADFCVTSKCEVSDDEVWKVNDDEKHVYGPIPRYNRVHQVLIEAKTRCFTCSCCMQERMGFPCCHIASVCSLPDSAGNIIYKEMNGFPVDSISVFWWKDYYNYGMSLNPEHQTLRYNFKKLLKNDTPGLVLTKDLPLFVLDRILSEQMLKKFALPPAYRVLNYSPEDATKALRKTKDRDNPHLIDPQAPLGLSQISRLPDDDVSSDLTSNCELLEDFDEVSLHTRHAVSREYNEVTEAINNSDYKLQLEELFKETMRKLIVQARKGVLDTPGIRVSMIPPNCKRRKTHGISD